MFENPFISSFLKFAILGTAGEILSKLILRQKLSLKTSLWSLIVWGSLGILIKFIFTGFHGFTENLVTHGYLPEGLIFKAFFTSFFTNAMFGPWVIILHRYFDSLITNKPGVSTEGLKGAMMTLIWFWLPAHTITFSLSPDWQITLAAIWSFVLGLILGIFKNRKKKE